MRDAGETHRRAMIQTCTTSPSEMHALTMARQLGVPCIPHAGGAPPVFGVTDPGVAHIRQFNTLGSWHSLKAADFLASWRPINPGLPCI